MAVSVICPSCGHRQELDDGFSRRKVRCPECGVLCPVPEASAAPARKQSPTVDEEALASRLLDEVEEPVKQPAREPKPAIQKTKPKPPPVPRKPLSDPDADDGQAYIVEGGEERLCPGCNRLIEPETVLCVHCGLDINKGKKVRRTYEPLARSWDLGVAFERRWRYCLLLSLAGLALSIGGTFVTGTGWHTLLVPWLVFTSMLCYLLGTFFRMELVRDRKGKVKLTRTWRIGFFPLAPKDVDLSEIGGVRIDLSRDVGLFEWLLCFILLLYGIVPGILWWLHVIHKDRWNVVLTRDHGQAVELLYRGTDGELAKVVAATLRDAGKLRQETV